MGGGGIPGYSEFREAKISGYSEWGGGGGYSFEFRIGERGGSVEFRIGGGGVIGIQNLGEGVAPGNSEWEGGGGGRGSWVF